MTCSLATTHGSSTLRAACRFSTGHASFTASSVYPGLTPCRYFAGCSVYQCASTRFPKHRPAQQSLSLVWVCRLPLLAGLPAHCAHIGQANEDMISGLCIRVRYSFRGRINLVIVQAWLSQRS